jgi:hypothetical protein
MVVIHRVPVFIMVLCAGFLVYPLRAQISVHDVQALEGPWECRNSNGVAGVFITTNTLPTSQSSNILVYQRRGEQEHDGTFGASTGRDGSAVFDGKRLIIHKARTEAIQFDLDVSFDAAADHWTGSWSLCDQPLDVVLERPHAVDGVHPSAFVGDWEGYPDPTARFPGAPGSLHVRQSYDGRLTAWLDRTIHNDQRNGEQLRILSATQSVIVLETINSSGARYRYEGNLSGDGKKIAGQWRGGLGGLGGTLNAPTLYRLLGPHQSTNQ